MVVLFVTGLAQVVLSFLSHVYSVDALDCACRPMSPEVYPPHTDARPFVFAQQPFPILFVGFIRTTCPSSKTKTDISLADSCSVWPIYVANSSGEFCLGSDTLPLVVLEACWTVMSESSVQHGRRSVGDGGDASPPFRVWGTA